MYTLSDEVKIRVIAAMVEGSSIRSTERMTGVHRDTIMRLVVRVGENCERLLDERMRKLSCKQIQADEIWTYVGKKERRVRFDDNPGKPGARVGISLGLAGFVSGKLGQYPEKHIWYIAVVPGAAF